MITIWIFFSYFSFWNCDKRLSFTMCDFNDPFCVNALPQIEQTYGFRPSCVILWRVKLVRVLNDLWQTSQRLSWFELLVLLAVFWCVLLLFVVSYFEGKMYKLTLGIEMKCLFKTQIIFLFWFLWKMSLAHRFIQLIVIVIVFQVLWFICFVCD